MAHTKKIRRLFFLFQTAVFVGAFAVFVFAITNSYVKKSQQKIRDDLDGVARLIVQQIQGNADIPGKGVGPYLFFIINQKDGSYVVPRGENLDRDNALWEQYRSKLTYQMQQQGRGWASYPAKAPGQYLQSQKLIRYLQVKELGWIVVVEGELVSEGVLARDIINKDNLANLLVIALISLLIMRFITAVYFVKLEQQISDFSDSGFLTSYPPTPIKSQVSEISEKEEEHGKESVISDFDEIGEKIESPPVKSETPSGHPAFPVKKNREVAEGQTSAEMEKRTPLKMEEAEYHWTVNMQRIKSPVLKKMIGKLRSQKEKS